MRTAEPDRKMVELFKKELVLCKVGPGQTVGILSEGNSARDYALGFIQAAKELGADPIDVNLPSHNNKSANERLANLADNALVGNRQAIERLKTTDLVIDLIFLLFSKEQIEIESGGARVLLVVEPLEILERLMPTEDQHRRVQLSEELLKNASQLRFTNAAGTDVLYELGKARLLPEYGFADTPGRWDHWPGGFLSTYAVGDIRGKVVMAPGDILYPFKEFVKDPIEFTVMDGMIQSIDGGESAQKLQSYMENYDDPRAFAVSHIGWGLNEKCEWRVDFPGVGMDGRAYYGNVLFSTGPNTEFGGDNDTACHLDLPMKNCSLWLDGDLILRDGEFTIPELRASRSAT